MIREPELNESPFDAAALAGSAVATALAIYVNPGPFNWMSVVVGITLLAIIFAFEKARKRGFSQSFALAAASGLVSLLLAGFILELYLGRGDLSGICNDPKGACRSNEFESRVGNELLALVWVVVTGIILLADRYYMKKGSSK